MGHSWERSGVFRSLHPFSLPRALNDSFPPRVFAGRMSQSGREAPHDPSLSAANGGLMATRCQFHAYHLTHWGALGLGSILRAIRRKGRCRDIALRLVCASLRDHLPACVHLSFPSSKVCRDLACTLASARGAVAPLQIPRAAYVWVLRCTIRRRLSLDEPSPPDGPRQPNIDVPGFS
jgi:hypothetical protein